MLSLALALALAAAPVDAGIAADPEPLRAPLGRIGDAVTPVAAEGTSSSERAVTVKLDGCDRLQTIWVSRFLLGAATAGGQVQDWLNKRPEYRTRLFGKTQPLVEAVQRARRTTPRANGCYSALAPWQVGTDKLPGDKLPGQTPSGWRCDKPGLALGDHLFDEKGRLAAVTRVSAAAAEVKDRCRPRLSALLADDRGIPRFALHADYGGQVTAHVFGDKCRRLEFAFDEPSQSFIPSQRLLADCNAKKPKTMP